MEIRINPEKKVLTLIDAEGTESFEFKEIAMYDNYPIWRVELINGDLLLIDFKEAKRWILKGVLNLNNKEDRNDGD